MMMVIRELTTSLQKEIDIRLKHFNENHDKIKALSLEIEQLETKMAAIVIELEPVECLVYNQNPQLEKIFESLKRVYGKEDNAIDRETY
jgi:hypothetical protein